MRAGASLPTPRHRGSRLCGQPPLDSGLRRRLKNRRSRKRRGETFGRRGAGVSATGLEAKDYLPCPTRVSASPKVAARTLGLEVRAFEGAAIRACDAVAEGQRIVARRCFTAHGAARSTHEHLCSRSTMRASSRRKRVLGAPRPETRLSADDAGSETGAQSSASTERAGALGHTDPLHGPDKRDRR